MIVFSVHTYYPREAAAIRTFLQTVPRVYRFPRAGYANNKLGRIYKILFLFVPQWGKSICKLAQTIFFHLAIIHDIYPFC